MLPTQHIVLPYTTANNALDVSLCALTRHDNILQLLQPAVSGVAAYRRQRVPNCSTSEYFICHSSSDSYTADAETSAPNRVERLYLSVLCQNKVSAELLSPAVTAAAIFVRQRLATPGHTHSLIAISSVTGQPSTKLLLASSRLHHSHSSPLCFL